MRRGANLSCLYLPSKMTGFSCRSACCAPRPINGYQGSLPAIITIRLFVTSQTRFGCFCRSPSARGSVLCLLPQHAPAQLKRPYGARLRPASCWPLGWMPAS